MKIVQILTNYHHRAGLSAEEKARVECAAQLLLAEPDSMVLISGAQLGFSPADMTHHELVAEELGRQGIDDSRILGRLTEADSTVKEAAHAQALLSEVHFESLSVVTSISHVPRAPYVFAHFFPLERLRFHVVPDTNTRDVLLLTKFKEAEAYHMLRSQAGVFVPPNTELIPTPFNYEEFSSLLATQTRVWSSAPEHDTDAGTEDLDLFDLYRPERPFGRRE